MFRTTVRILALVSFMFIFSCSDSSTEPKNDGDTVTDFDGNIYKTVKIGDQVWMAENLKTEHYRNGDAIPKVTENSQWVALTSGALCSYENDDSHIAVYGLLYNWYAVVDSRNIAPKGWHVPTSDELQTLIDFLGQWRTSGGKLKEAGLEHWQSPNAGATNESGFTALPSGYRSFTGLFDRLNTIAFIWSTDLDNTGEPKVLNLTNTDAYAYLATMGKTFGFSIRCIKD